MADITLINGYRTGRPYLPVGIGYLAQAIESAGLAYDVCDVNLQTREQIVRFIKERKPRYVGLGTMTHQVEKNYDLLGAIRDSAPEVTIILGGPHAIAGGKQIFSDCRSIDIVIQGEGEKSLVEVLQGKPLREIPGTLSKAVQDGAKAVEFLEVNSVDFPRYHKFDLARYGNTMQLASSRGCVYQCTFCGAPRFLGNKWRAFTAERMIEEYEYWRGRGYKQFCFSDSLFALNKNRVTTFCRHVAGSNSSDVAFTADGIRADHVTFDLLQLMKMANFKSLTFGVESVHDSTLKFFKKGESFREIDGSINIADSLGFDITIYLIVGAPGETAEQALESIRYPMKYRNVVNSIVTKLSPIQGTAYYEYALEHGLVRDTSCRYPTIEAFGWNEKSPEEAATVEEMWNAVYPSIGKVNRLLKQRRWIKENLRLLGMPEASVKTMNILARVSLYPLLSTMTTLLFRVAGKAARTLRGA